MTSRTHIIIAISAIAVFAATVGFFITLNVSPQIAYARLFIDAGLVIGLVAVVMAFYREKELPQKGVLQALKNLKDGQYKIQAVDEVGLLSDISRSINELALKLADRHEKQEEIKRNLRAELLPELKPKDAPKEKEVVKEIAKEPIKEKVAITSGHSLHPELGPVLTIPFEKVKPSPIKPESRPVEKPFAALSNTLIDSEPPQLESSMLMKQDIGELYERFIEAQRDINQEKIEYHLFLKTIESTRQELMASHQCQGIMFDIVAKAEQVALQPKIIR